MAMDTVHFDGCTADNPVNELILNKYCSAKQSDHTGGRLKNSDRMTGKPTLTLKVLANSRNDANLILQLQAYAAIHGRNRNNTNIYEEFILRWAGCLLKDIIDQSNNENKKPHAGAKGKRLTNTEFHGSITPSHPSYIHAYCPIKYNAAQWPIGYKAMDCIGA